MHGVFHMFNHLIWYLAGAEELFAQYGYGFGGYGYGTVETSLNMRHRR